MKKIFFSALVLSGLLAMGCSTITPMGATGNAAGSKTGEASANFLFGAIPIPLNNDYSINTAAKNGNLRTISTYDVKTKSILGIWVTRTTIVTGE